jgi:rod shape-determining protein MreD
MYIRWIFKALLILGLLILQLAFISGLPGQFANVNAVLVLVLLIMAFGDFREALIWSIAVGALLDMYSYAPFGLNMFCLVLALLVANFLQINFLTNRSLYSVLALSMVASLVFELFALMIYWVAGFFSDFKTNVDLGFNFWLDELSKILANMVLAFLLFHLLSFVSRRFRPIFLVR